MTTREVGICRQLPCPHPYPLPELLLVNCIGEGDMLLNSNEAPSLLIQKGDRKLLGHSFQNDQDHCMSTVDLLVLAGPSTLSLFGL